MLENIQSLNGFGAKTWGNGQAYVSVGGCEVLRQSTIRENQYKCSRP